MNVLFVKRGLPWPRTSGQDVHASGMMRGLADLGHRVGLLTMLPIREEAVRGLGLSWTGVLDLSAPTLPGTETLWTDLTHVPLPYLQNRFQSYWGVDPKITDAVREVSRWWNADAVAAVGLEALPYLAAINAKSPPGSPPDLPPIARIWYAADEWLWHHVTLMHPLRPRTWKELRKGVLKGLYERAFRSSTDRVWVVTSADRRAVRWVMGVRNADLLPNGVDHTYYCPQDAPIKERSCAFWGRLDFAPNVTALQWFWEHVWPLVRKAAPDASMSVYGFAPGPEIASRNGWEGVTIRADLPDLRAEAASHGVAVFPMVSGAGIKNKVLEAAALGMAVIVTPRACLGLRLDSATPLLVAKRPQQWCDALLRIWNNPQVRLQCQSAARTWVVNAHDWSATAKTAVQFLGKE